MAKNGNFRVHKPADVYNITLLIRGTVSRTLCVRSPSHYVVCLTTATGLAMPLDYKVKLLLPFFTKAVHLVCHLTRILLVTSVLCTLIKTKSAGVMHLLRFEQEAGHKISVLCLAGLVKAFGCFICYLWTQHCKFSQVPPSPELFCESECYIIKYQLVIKKCSSRIKAERERTPSDEFKWCLHQS